jgi:RAP1 GTPase activating protein 1
VYLTNVAHQNFLAVDSTRGPLAVSVIKDGTTYKALVRSNLGCDRLTVPTSRVKNTGLQKLLSRKPNLGQIVAAMGFLFFTTGNFFIMF